MIRRPFLWSLIGLVAAGAVARGDDPPKPRPIPITVRAGRFDRRDSVIKFSIPAGRLAPTVDAAVIDRPFGLSIRSPTGPADPAATVAEGRRRPDGTIDIAWILPRPLPAGEEAHFEVDGEEVRGSRPLPWSGTATLEGEVTVRHGSNLRVFQYNAVPTVPPPSQPNPFLVRAAYIHPAYSPAGALVTGDFSSFHPHHRGLFLAYVHTKWGDLAPDFWNIQSGTGRIVADGFAPPSYGPVVYRLAARHRWEAIRPSTPATTTPEHPVALRERWEIELYDVPGSPYWLFDLTSTQQAEQHPLELLPYRYGGMAYRSAEPSVIGPIDVLTAEGRHRLDGDQKPTRWVDLTGPIADRSPKYAGAMIVDHPSNLRYPNVVRIHPITLPFFSFVPGHDTPLTIATDRPTVFRYRVMIHDGRPDPALNDRIARDFAEPPTVIVGD